MVLALMLVLMFFFRTRAKPSANHIAVWCARNKNTKEGAVVAAKKTQLLMFSAAL